MGPLVDLSSLGQNHDSFLGLFSLVWRATAVGLSRTVRMSIPYLESQIMKVGAPVVVPPYVDQRTSPDVVARFANGQARSIERAREQSDPGPNGEAPPTLALYERAIAELGPMRRVLDAGCG